MWANPNNMPNIKNVIFISIGVLLFIVAWILCDYTQFSWFWYVWFPTLIGAILFIMQGIISIDIDEKIKNQKSQKEPLEIVSQWNH